VSDCQHGFKFGKYHFIGKDSIQSVVMEGYHPVKALQVIWMRVGVHNRNWRLISTCSSNEKRSAFEHSLDEKKGSGQRDMNGNIQLKVEPEQHGEGNNFCFVHHLRFDSN